MGLAARFAGIVALLLLLACATLPGAVHSPVDGVAVERAQSGAGPVVVFVHGLGATMQSWDRVFPAVAKEALVFASSRPGYGRSAPVSGVRDGSRIVAELRSLLKSQGLRPPYVLVGHSLGGLYVQLYARLFPEEVKALILVDSTHPLQMRGAGSPNLWPAWVGFVFWLWSNETVDREFAAIDATGQEVLRLPAYTGPVFVLSAVDKGSGNGDLAQYARFTRADLERMYPNSRAIEVNSGHQIPRESPTAIIAAVHEALRMSDAMRKECAEPTASQCGPAAR